MSLFNTNLILYFALCVLVASMWCIHKVVWIQPLFGRNTVLSSRRSDFHMIDSQSKTSQERWTIKTERERGGECVLWWWWWWWKYFLSYVKWSSTKSSPLQFYLSNPSFTRQDVTKDKIQSRVQPVWIYIFPSLRLIDYPKQNKTKQKRKIKQTNLISPIIYPSMEGEQTCSCLFKQKVWRVKKNKTKKLLRPGTPISIPATINVTLITPPTLYSK